MLTDLTFGFGKKKLATIGVVEFDASVEESYQDDAEVTGHPVESGIDVSDHIRIMPKTVTIHGLVTNTPMVRLASLFAKSPKTNDRGRVSDRVEAAYAELRRVQEAGELVTVTTSLREYTNMVITSISVVRDVQKGNILDSNITLREIRIANSLSIDLPIPVDIANKVKTKNGSTGKETASTKQSTKSTSILSQMKSALSSFIGG